MFLKSAVTALVALTSLTGLAVPPAANPANAPSSVALGQPLAAAHAHNDYEHDRPLLDALEHGFTSVEADVWLVDGELLVAHDLEDAKPGVTLKSLYLDPLDELVRNHGHSVYPHWDGSLQLLIDIKSEGEATYAAIEQELSEHRDIMSRSATAPPRPDPSPPSSAETVPWPPCRHRTSGSASMTDAPPTSPPACLPN